MSCNRHYGLKNWAPCSGHGICVNGKCQCESSWTWKGDMELFEGYDCEFNIAGIKIWNAISLFLALISFLSITNLLRQIIHSSTNYILDDRRLCLLSMLATNMAGTIYHICKVVDPELYVIGNSPMISVIIVITLTGAVFAGTFFSKILVKFLKDYSRVIDSTRRGRFYRLIDHITYLAQQAPYVTCVSMTTVYTLFYKLPNRYHEVMSMLGFLLLTIVFAFYAISMEYIIVIFLQEMKSFLHRAIQRQQSRLRLETNSSKASDSLIDTVKHIESKMKRTNTYLLPFLVCGIIISLMFTCWHFLRRKLTYLVTFQLMSLHIMGPLISWSITSVIQGNTANESRILSILSPNGISSKSYRIGMMSNVIFPSNQSNKTVKIVAVVKSLEQRQSFV